MRWEIFSLDDALDTVEVYLATFTHLVVVAAYPHYMPNHKRIRLSDSLLIAPFSPPSLPFSPIPSPFSSLFPFLFLSLSL